MKELSVEEKAKAYDEALKVLHKYDGANIMFSQSLKEEMFPEFREESEDKRIRKWIIGVLSTYEHDKNLRDDAIAWLEKQGEQKVSVAEFKAKDWYVSKVDGKIYNAKFMEKTPTNQARRLEIEKAAMSATGIIEQEEWFIKGAEWSDKNPSYISSEKQGEQKPAWSEEDELMLTSIIQTLKLTNGAAQMKIDWLKSLRPQNHWKPSDEQMDALRYVTNFDYGGHKSTLVSLYEQLKKLK